MKRIISVLLVFVLCFNCVVVTVFAADVNDDIFIDILALDESTQHSFQPNSDYFTWSINTPFVDYKYVDVLFYSNASPYSVNAYGSNNSLNVVHVGDNYYRAYGDYLAWSEGFWLNFNFNSTCSILDIISCRVSKIHQDTFALGGSWNGYTSLNSFWSGTFDGESESTIAQETTGGGYYVNYTYDYDIRFFPGITDDWKAYDKISLTFGFYGYTINSISAYVDGVDVLQSVSYLNNGSYSDLRHNIDGYYYLESSNDWRYVDLVLDLTNVQKTTDEYPVIRITGIYEPTTSFESLFSIGRCNGIIIDDFDSDAYWFKKIFRSIDTTLIDKLTEQTSAIFSLMAVYMNNISTWLTDLGNYVGLKFDELFTHLGHNFNQLGLKFDELFTHLGHNFNQLWIKLDTLINGSADQNDSAGDFKDSVSDQSNELEEISGIMNSVEKPDSADINIDVSSFVDSNAVYISTIGFSSILGNEIILRVLLLAFSFALVGFILYGKK